MMSKDKLVRFLMPCYVDSVYIITLLRGEPLTASRSEVTEFVELVVRQ